MLLFLVLCGFGSAETLALGIGAVVRQPVFGAPLRVEIPLLLGESETPPQHGCARIQELDSSVDAQFFPRDARVLIEARGRPRVLVVASRGVVEPIVEFRLSVGCSDVVTRDFVLLADAPPAPNIEERHVAANADARNALPREGTTRFAATDTTVSSHAAILPSAISLNAIARQRYPASREKRDEYRHLMVAANPRLFQAIRNPGARQLLAGTELRTPENIPPIDPGPVAQIARSAPSNARPPRSGSHDRLLVGSRGLSDPRYLASGEALAIVKRMEGMLDEQKQIEVQIDNSLRAANSAFEDTRRRFREIEETQERQTRGMRETQARMDSADKKIAQSLGLWELLLVVMASGATGAGLLILHDRLAVGRGEVKSDRPAESEYAPRPLPAAGAAPDAARTETPQAVPSLPPKPPASRSVNMRMADTPEVKQAAEPSAVTGPTRQGDQGKPVPPSSSVFPMGTPVVAFPEPLSATNIRMPGRLRHVAKEELLPTTVAASIGLDGSHAESINRLLPELPCFDVCAWFEAFDFLRENDERKAFASLALQLNEKLNVELPSWDRDSSAKTSSLLDYPRITDFLQTLWRGADRVLTRVYLVDLLADNRGGTRNGFTEGAATDIAVLIGIIDIQDAHDIQDSPTRGDGTTG